MIMNCQSHARSLWPPDYKSILVRLLEGTGHAIALPPLRLLLPVRLHIEMQESVSKHVVLMK